MERLSDVFGGWASFAVLKEYSPVAASSLASLAGLLPAIYEKLKVEASTEELFSQAGQYKNLENRFRQAAAIISLEGEDKLKSEFESLMLRIEDLKGKTSYSSREILSDGPRQN